jgi:hypothetical protein
LKGKHKKEASMNVQVFDKDAVNEQLLREIQILLGNSGEERPIYFRLVPSVLGVTLCVVDYVGNATRSGTVLSITRDGKVLPHAALNPDVGLSVVNGSIEILSPPSY